MLYGHRTCCSDGLTEHQSHQKTNMFVQPTSLSVLLKKWRAFCLSMTILIGECYDFIICIFIIMRITNIYCVSYFGLIYIFLNIFPISFSSFSRNVNIVMTLSTLKKSRFLRNVYTAEYMRHERVVCCLYYQRKADAD